MSDLANLPAYGGPGWQPRGTSLRQELGTHWSPCGMDSEWRTLKAVLLHAPGRELEAVRENPEAHLLREAPDPDRCRVEHEELALAYREEGVEVHHVAPPSLPPPNQMFVADLMVMTPEGVILGRPASAVRAGEERWVARTLGELGVPVLRSVRGRGTFEGADLMWLGPEAALLARGLRTNPEGAAQVKATLEELGVDVVETDLPPGTMHLMGQLRIVDDGLAIAWPGRFPAEAAHALERRNVRVIHLPDEALSEAKESFGLNFVVLGPRHVLMPTGNPRSQAFYEGLGIRCRTVEVREIGKAAGSIGCLSGVLEREMHAGA
jgi:arginine deiminase